MDSNTTHTHTDIGPAHLFFIFSFLILFQRLIRLGFTLVLICFPLDVFFLYRALNRKQSNQSLVFAQVPPEESERKILFHPRALWLSSYSSLSFSLFLSLCVCVCRIQGERIRENRGATTDGTTPPVVIEFVRSIDRGNDVFPRLPIQSEPSSASFFIAPLFLSIPQFYWKETLSPSIVDTVFAPLTRTHTNTPCPIHRFVIIANDYLICQCLVTHSLIY